MLAATVISTVVAAVAVIVVFVKVELVRRLGPIVRVVWLVWVVRIVGVRARLIIRHPNHSRLLSIRVINHGPSSLNCAYYHCSTQKSNCQEQFFVHFSSFFAAFSPGRYVA